MKRTITPILFCLLAILVNSVAWAQEETKPEFELTVIQGELAYILAPAEWYSLREYETPEEALDAILADNPDFTGGTESFANSMSNETFDIILFDPVTRSSASVIAIDIGAALTIQDLESTILGQYETLEAELITTEYRDLPAGEAFFVHSTATTAADVTAEQYQYALMDGTIFYVITLGGDTELFEDVASLFDDMIESFGIGEAPEDLLEQAAESGEKSTDSENAETDAETGSDKKSTDSESSEKPDKINTAGIGDSMATARTDIQKFETPDVSFVVPATWFSVRDTRGIEDYLASGETVQTFFQSYVDTLGENVASGSYSLAAVDAQNNVLMIGMMEEIGADVDITIFEPSMVDTVKADAEMSFIASEYVELPIGKALRIELTRPIAQDIVYHEYRYIVTANQNLYIFIFDAEENIFPNHQQTFIDVMNTLSFPE